ncbi:MAG TPA: protein kinase [Terriglobales bacterium]|nr:protein kinase [Terriglobales bacterium]
MSEEINKRVGDYQILNELGSGGMGRVYKVRNVISDRIEAMKVLLPDLAGRQELATRFLREIKLMASLNHPNIAQLRTAFTADNQLVMIMEYVEGTTLADRLEKHGPIPVPEAVNYIGQVLDALSYAHGQHVIHRDIKPANIMVTPQGAVKLMDFGIARAGDGHSLTMTGTTLGSLGYMSPEQVKGEVTDARSDLYSVGVSLYEMVTGQRPFRADSDFSLMTAHVKEAPKPPVELQPGLPPALNEIILMAISKDPAQRFQSADAFANALSSVSMAAAAEKVAAQDASEASTAEYTVAAPSVPATPPKQVITPLRAPTAAKPAAVSVPASVLAQSPLPSSGHRGLYMALGALIVLAVLVAGGIYLPRHSKTEARQNDAQQSAPPASQTNAAMPNTIPNTVQPQTAPANSVLNSPTPESPQPAPPATAPAEGISNAVQSSPVPPPPAPRPKKLNSQAIAAGQQSSAPAQTANQAASPDQMAPAIDRDEVERQIDQVSNRAAAVNGSLDRLQQQQSAAGYGLRGDMAAKQASMNTNLSRAESAMQRGDVATAKKHAAMAEGDAEALEHFLGH